MKNYDTIIFFDTVEDRFAASSLELVSFSRAISGNVSSVCGLIAGKNISSPAEYLSEKTGLDIIALECDDLFFPNHVLLSETAFGIAVDYNSANLCFMHTPKNCAAAAGLAVKLKASCVTGVESVRREDEKIIATRSIFNGKLKQTVNPDFDKKIFTVTQGAFPSLGDDSIPPSKGRIIKRKFICAEKKFIPTQLSCEQSAGVKLEEADIIISAGRGIGSGDNLFLLNEMAALFKNSAVGASRPLCDLKWMPYSRQIGATGRTVSPRLYFALGISGSQQHIAGMKGSQCVVAVNTDSNAAIFSVSDFIIVEDASKFIAEFIEAYRKEYIIK